MINQISFVFVPFLFSIFPILYPLSFALPSVCVSSSISNCNRINGLLLLLTSAWLSNTIANTTTITTRHRHQQHNNNINNIPTKQISVCVCVPACLLSLSVSLSLLLSARTLQLTKPIAPTLHTSVICRLCPVSPLCCLRLPAYENRKYMHKPTHPTPTKTTTTHSLTLTHTHAYDLCKNSQIEIAMFVV